MELGKTKQNETKRLPTTPDNPLSVSHKSLHAISRDAATAPHRRGHPRSPHPDFSLTLICPFGSLLVRAQIAPTSRGCSPLPDTRRSSRPSPLDGATGSQGFKRSPRPVRLPRPIIKVPQLVFKFRKFPRPRNAGAQITVAAATRLMESVTHGAPGTRCPPTPRPAGAPAHSARGRIALPTPRPPARAPGGDDEGGFRAPQPNTGQNLARCVAVD